MQKLNNKGYLLLDAILALGTIAAIATVAWGLLKMGKACSDRVSINSKVQQMQGDSIQLALDMDTREAKALFCFNGILEDAGEFSNQGTIRLDGIDSTCVNTPQSFLAEWQKKNINIHLKTETNATCLIVIGSEFKLIGFYKIQFNALNECSLERWTPFNNQLICTHKIMQKPSGRHALRPKFEWMHSGKVMAILPSILFSNIQERGLEIRAIRS